MKQKEKKTDCLVGVVARRVAALENGVCQVISLYRPLEGRTGRGGT